MVRSIFLHFNETIIILFISNSINLNEDVKIAHSKMERRNCYGKKKNNKN